MTYMVDLANLKHLNAIKNLDENNYNPIIYWSNSKNRDIYYSLEEVLNLVDKTLKSCLNLDFSVFAEYLVTPRNNTH